MVKHISISESENISMKEIKESQVTKDLYEMNEDEDAPKVNPICEAPLLKFIDQVNTNSFENIVRDFRGHKLKHYLSTAGELTSLQKEVLIGCLLGDGNLQSNGGTNFFFKFDQKAANHAYVTLIYLIFQQFVGTPPALRWNRGEPHSWWFRTYRLPSLKFYHDQFYGLDAHGNSVRMVPRLLHRWITPISLAFWFMDDGGRVPYGYCLHTQCFPLHQVKNLQKLLGNKFGLEVNVLSDTKKDTSITYYYLYITSGSVRRFTELVQPYIIPCMQYKLHDLSEPRFAK